MWKQELKDIMKNNINGVQSSDCKNANQVTIDVLLDFTQYLLENLARDIYVNAVNTTMPSNEQMNFVRNIRYVANKWDINLK